MLLSLLYTIQKISVELTLLKDFCPLNHKASLVQHHNFQENVAQLNETKFDKIIQGSLTKIPGAGYLKAG